MGGSACDDDDEGAEAAAVAVAAAAADFTAVVVGKWTLGPSGKNAFAGAGGLTVELDDDAEDAMTAAGTRIVREIGMGESAVGTAERLKKQSVSKKLRRSAQLTAETL
jgi:cbb3-type cytochrome oxidase subunit 3